VFTVTGGGGAPDGNPWWKRSGLVWHGSEWLHAAQPERAGFGRPGWVGGAWAARGDRDTNGWSRRGEQCRRHACRRRQAGTVESGSGLGGAKRFSAIETVRGTDNAELREGPPGGVVTAHRTARENDSGGGRGAVRLGGV